MKNDSLNIVQLIIAAAAVVISIVVPFVHFIYLPGFSILTFIKFNVCLVFLVVPVVHLLTLFFATPALKKLSPLMGGIALIVDVVFVFIAGNIILSPSLAVLLNNVSSMAISALGLDNVNINSQEAFAILRPFLVPDIGFWILVLCDVAYMVCGLFLMSSGGSKRSSSNISGGMNF